MDVTYSGEGRRSVCCNLAEMMSEVSAVLDCPLVHVTWRARHRMSKKCFSRIFK